MKVELRCFLTKNRELVTNKLIPKDAIMKNFRQKCITKENVELKDGVKCKKILNIWGNIRNTQINFEKQRTPKTLGGVVCVYYFDCGEEFMHIYISSSLLNCTHSIYAIPCISITPQQDYFKNKI